MRHGCAHAGLELLRAAGKAGKTATEMEQLLAICRHRAATATATAADPGGGGGDTGLGLIRTLSQRERERAAAAAAAVDAAQAEQDTLDAELKSVSQQVRTLDSTI
jgi:hypothetical protein